jgi:hypothetical protein
MIELTLNEKGLFSKKDYMYISCPKSLLNVSTFFGQCKHFSQIEPSKKLWFLIVN